MSSSPTTTPSPVSPQACSSGTPINKTELLLELLDRVHSVEERQEQTKAIRFFEPDETISDGVVWKDAAIFEWTPNNISSNAIILISYYAEYKAFIHTDYESMYVYWRIAVNDSVNWDDKGFQLDQNITDYTWTPSHSITGGTKPNQTSYTIKFQISTNLFATAYFRNVNIILTVIDGLPAS